MKKLFLTITLGILVPLKAQSQYFERTLDPPALIGNCSDTNWNAGLDIKLLEDDYIILSNTSQGTSGCEISGGTGYTLHRLNIDGDTIFNMTFWEPSMLNDLAGALYPKAMSISEDNSIYVVGTISDYTLPERIFLSRHDEHGNLLETHYYSVEDYLSPSKLLTDGQDVYIGGDHRYDFNKFSPAVMKLDLNGNVSWFEFTEISSFFGASAMIKTENGFALTGSMIPLSGSGNYRIFMLPFNQNGLETVHFYGNPATPYSTTDAIYSNTGKIVIAAFSFYQLEVFEINSSGAVEHQFAVPTNPAYNYFYMSGLIQTTDSNYVLIGNKNYSLDTIINNYARSLIIQKFDHSGTMLWETEYVGEMTEGIALDSNAFILTGSRFNQQFGRYQYTTLALKADGDGKTHACTPQFFPFHYDSRDTMWRADDIYLYNNSYGEAGDFEWFVNGESYSTDFMEYYSAIDTGWVYITLVGCNSEFTDSVYIMDWTLGTTQLSLDDNLSVYPNPFSDEIRIDLLKSDKISIQINDIAGKHIYNEETQSKTTVLSTSGWKPGVYLLHVSSNDQTSIIKVIKN